MTLSEEEFANKDDSILLKSIKLQKWDKALKHLDEAQEADVYGNLPLHAAIGFKAPDDFVLRLLQIYPDATKVHGTDEWLPLHVAAMWGTSSVVMEALIRAHPQALDDGGQDNIKGKTPRHYSTRFEHNRKLLERPTDEWMALIGQPIGK